MTSLKSFFLNSIFIFSSILMCHCNIHAVEINFTVSPNTIKIGQPFISTISLKSNEKIEILNTLKQDDFKDIYLINQSLKKTTDGVNINHQLQVFSTEISHIPTLNLFISKNNLRHKIIIPQFPLQLSSHFSSEDQQNVELSEIFDNLSLIFPLNHFLLIASILIIIIGALWWVYKTFYKPKKTDSTPIETPYISPLNEALEALKALQSENLFEQEKFKEHYSKLSDIIKHFASRKTKLKLLETTSKECLQALTSCIPEYSLAKLNNILTYCDMVKFAKLSPSLEKHQQVLEKTNEWIHKTEGDIPDELC